VAVCINIGSLPLDVRLAILSIRKSAAANRAHLAYCIPAILDAAPIGFRFIDVSRSHVCHDDLPVFQRPNGLSLRDRKVASSGDSRTTPI
jgi:hypothetical protein